MQIRSDELLGFLDRLEPIQAEIVDLKNDMKVIMAEAARSGLSPKGVRLCLKVRALSPSEFQAGEQLRDIYLAGIGMAAPPPLFRALETLAGESLGRDALIEQFKQLVPAKGEITLRVDGGAPVRFWRDAEGTAYAEEVAPPPPAPASPSSNAKPSPAPSRRAAPDVPDVDPDGAEQLGKDAAVGNKPIISNPFPYGDPRRARFDVGWRKQSGNDGMGPNE